MFECSHCKEVFTVPVYLPEHLKVCDGFRGNIATAKLFNSERSLKGDSPVVVNKLSSNDEMCGASPTNCQVGASVGHSQKRRCYMTRKRRDRLRKQQQRENEVHICLVCRKVFCSRSSLNKHGKNHLNKRQHACEVCGRGFNHASDLSRHQTVHASTREHPCRQCPKAFAHKGQLTAHLKVHSGVKDYMCDLCGGRFSRLSGLKEHRLIHAGGKTQRCGLCGGTLAHPNHLPCHGGESAHTCSVCSKSFRTKSSLRSHLSVHSAVNRHPCGECGRTFSKSSSLQAHNKIHGDTCRDSASQKLAPS